MSDFFDEIFSARNSSGVERTIVSKETVIQGNISTPYDIIIDGAIKGHVKSGKNVELTGRLEGDITADTVLISDGIIKGNIFASGEVIVVGNSTVVGDLECHSLEFNAKLKGNITAKETVLLKKGAVVQGDITAKNFSADDGTKLIGYLNIIRPETEETDVVGDIDSLLMFEDIASHYGVEKKPVDSSVKQTETQKNILVQAQEKNIATETSVSAKNNTVTEASQDEVEMKTLAKVVKAAQAVTAINTPTPVETTPKKPETTEKVEKPVAIRQEIQPEPTRAEKPLGTTFGAVLQNAVRQVERVREESAAINSEAKVEDTTKTAKKEEEPKPISTTPVREEPKIATGTIAVEGERVEEVTETSGNSGNFVLEKQKVLDDLKKRLEKAKRSGVTPEQP